MTAVDHVVRLHQGRVEVTLPIRTVSESNQREHWAKKAARAKGQRATTALALRGPLTSLRDQLSIGDEPKSETRSTGHAGGNKSKVSHDTSRHAVTQVTLTRIAPRALDDDNLRGALKATRDGVADALGIDDRDARVEWRYTQERGNPRTYAVRVTVEVR